MRLVLDTNIVVSALVWGGMPFRLLQAATTGDIALFTSPALLAELRDVLTRSHIAPRLTQKRSSVEQAIGLYAGLAVHVSPHSVPRIVPGDIDDDHVIACAIAATAQGIVSGDHHILDLQPAWQGIEILTANQAVERLG